MAGTSSSEDKAKVDSRTTREISDSSSGWAWACGRRTLSWREDLGRYLGEGKGSAVARSSVGEVPGASEVVWAKALFQGGPGQWRRVIGIPGLLGRQRAVWASSSLTVTMTM